MVNHEKGVIFIHIPKTAGTSIELASNLEFNIKGGDATCYGYNERIQNWMQHLTVPELIENEFVKKNEFETYYSFTFVRNPWDRLISEVFYRFDDIIYNKEDVMNLIKQFFSETDLWIRKDFRCHKLPQVNFVFDINGKQLVNFIGRYENLQEDFNKICEDIGIENQILDHCHPLGGFSSSARRKHYRDYYDLETRKLVSSYYSQDIETFGYMF